MKRFSYIFFSVIAFLGILQTTFAAPPKVNCGGLPGCNGSATLSETSVYNIIGGIIATMIQYVAVIAVIAVMIGGIMYLVSSGDEEKIKKAKNIIIWSLIGVLVSVLAWSLIAIINNFRI